MKKSILILLILTTSIFAKINIVTSILPQVSIIKAIVGDKADIFLMVKRGNSPHTYEPKPSQMIAITKASIYFSIGVEFEDIWLSKFKSINPKLDIIDLSTDITKLAISNHHSTHHDHDHLDPHIWTSIKNIKLIANKIYKTLINIDSKNSDYYQKRLRLYMISLNLEDREIRTLLKDIKSRELMVFHPSWGYFANEYNLTQVAVEIDGKSPKPKEIIAIIKLAKKENIKAIFTQPEFSDKSAKIIAKEIGIDIIKVSPLSDDILKTILNIAKALSR